MTDSSLLNSELEFQQQEELYQQLLSQVLVPFIYTKTVAPLTWGYCDLKSNE